jgi:hypothetical protein
MKVNSWFRLVSLLIAFTLVSTASYAAVKPGGSCSKAGIKSISAGKTYTCIRSGKKLVWNKGALTPVAKPSPSATSSATPTAAPSASPTPTQTAQPAIDEVSRIIYAMRHELLDKTYESSGNFTFIFQGDTTAEVESKTKRSLLNAAPAFAKLGFKISNGLILVARDVDWIKVQLDANNCKYRSLPGRPGFYVGKSCKDGNGAVTSVHWEAEKFNDGLDGLYFNHVIPHEYFHQIQELLTPLGNADFPKWFWEGSAQFFTNQAWSDWNKQKSYIEWFEHWWRDLRPDLGAAACKNATIELMSNPETPGLEGICAYSKGQLLVEYFVAKYGLTKYREIYVQNTTPGWQNFGTVFKKVTGDELRDFYADADTFISSRGW